MTILFFILIIITCGVLAFFVLIQNPKGGGLAGSFGGLGNQMMGAKQSTDVVEKGTWVAASVLLALTLVSFMLAPKVKTDANEKTRSEKSNTGVQAPAMPAPQEAATPLPGSQGAQPANAVPAQPAQSAPAAPAQPAPSSPAAQPTGAAPTTK
jgi:preprotein translocase subunit SecG